jgi:hypothetical protein
MTDQETAAPLQRTRPLRRWLQRLAWAAIAAITTLGLAEVLRPSLVMALVAAYATLIATRNIVRAREFWATDGSGRPWVKVGTSLGGLGVQCPGIAIYDSNGVGRVGMGLLRDESPSIGLADHRGFEIVLGATWTAVPAADEAPKPTTTAASIVMFGADKSVIWRAP